MAERADKLAGMRLGAWLAAVLISTGGMVHAQSAKERAAELFEEGRAALKARQFREACRALDESQKLDPAPGTALNLALCFEQLGKLATALAHYQSVIADLPASDERAKFAAEQVVTLGPRVPKLTIVPAPGLPDGASVALDGVGVAAADLETPLPVDPGEHVVGVRAPGREDRSYRVALAEGSTRTVEVAAGPEPSLVDGGTGVPVETSDGLGTLQIAGIAAGGAGVVGLVIGGVMGGLVLSRKSTVEEQCDDTFCDTQEGIDAASEGATFSTVSTVAFVVGAAALGAGITMFVLGMPDDEHVALVARPGGWSLEGRF